MNGLGDRRGDGGNGGLSSGPANLAQCEMVLPNRTFQELPMRDESAAQRALGLCPICGGSRPAKVLQAPDRFYGRSAVYELVRCPSCSVVWLKNPPLPAEMGYHYGPEYHALIARSAETSRNRWQLHLDTLSKHNVSGALLDLGCSSGSFLASLKGPSWKLYGIEMAAASAKRAEARSGAQVFIGDILDAPFPSEFFDVITCFDVLEHVYEPRRVVAKVREWLKPGGIFYLLVPNIDCGEARFFRSYWYSLELPRHLTHFSPASLRRMTTSLGLEEVSLTTSNSIAFEYSVRYLLDGVLRSVGIDRVPLAKASVAGLSWRALRKAFRVSLLPVLHRVISLRAGEESIHAVFRKGILDSGSPAEGTTAHTWKASAGM